MPDGTEIAIGRRKGANPGKLTMVQRDYTPVPEFAPGWHLKLAGTLTLIDPVTISRPDQEHGVTTMTARIGGQTQHFICIPGEHLKGKFRRLSWEAIRDAVREHPGYAERFGDRKPFNLDDFYFNAVGGLKGDEAESTHHLLRNERLRRLNPLASLYGAATPWIKSRMTFRIARDTHPISMVGFGTKTRPMREDVHVTSGVRRDDFRADPHLFEEIGEEGQAQWKERNALIRRISPIRKQLEAVQAALPKLRRQSNSQDVTPEIQVTAKRDLATYESREKELQAEIDEIKKDPAYANSPLRPLDPVVAMPAGIEMTHGMEGKNLTLEEMGLLLETLRRFALDSRIGGNHSKGFGRIAGRYTMLLRGPGQRVLQPVGSLSFGGSFAEPDETGMLHFSVNDAASQTFEQAIEGSQQAWRDVETNVLGDRYAWGQPSDEVLNA